MKLQRTLAALVLAFPLIASAAAPSQGSVNNKHNERGIVAQIRDYVFGVMAEHAATRPAGPVRASQPTPGAKSIALNGLAPEALDAAGSLARLADHSLGR